MEVRCEQRAERSEEQSLEIWKKNCIQGRKTGSEAGVPLVWLEQQSGKVAGEAQHDGS